MNVEDLAIRAYYHRRELKKCYLLTSESDFDIKFGRIVPGSKLLGVRQKKNTFDIHEMRLRLRFLLQEHHWEDSFRFFSEPARTLWMPPGLVLDALDPNRVLGDWSQYGEYQIFAPPSSPGA